MRLDIFAKDGSHSTKKLGEAIKGCHDWTCYEVKEQIPSDAGFIQFGLTLTGPGQVELRNVELIPTRR
jgi:hypothetical protein